MSRIRSHTYITQTCNSSFCMNSESTTVKKYTTLLNEFFQSIFTASITIQSFQRAKFALITSILILKKENTSLATIIQLNIFISTDKNNIY